MTCTTPSPYPRCLFAHCLNHGHLNTQRMRKGRHQSTPSSLAVAQTKELRDALSALPTPEPTNHPKGGTASFPVTPSAPSCHLTLEEEERLKVPPQQSLVPPVLPGSSFQFSGKAPTITFLTRAFSIHTKNMYNKVLLWSIIPEMMFSTNLISSLDLE